MAKPRQKRGRNSRTLTRLAASIIIGCEYCTEFRADEYCDDVLVRLKMNSGERARIGRHLFCPNCEYHLDVHYDLVATLTDEEIRVSRRREVWAHKYEKRFRAFHQFLLKHQSLAGFHTIGQQLSQAVNLAPISTVESGSWFRARVPTNHGVIFRAADFLPPNPTQVDVSVGRYNHAGQSAFYLADSQKTAAVECLGNEEGEIWIAGVTITKQLRVLDIRTMRLAEEYQDLPLVLAGLVYEGVVSQPTAADRSRPQYHVPRFIADLVRRRGLDGILYTSSKEYPFRPDVFGTNLVLLRPIGEDMLSIEAPQHLRWVRSDDGWFEEMKLEQI